jgi:hypothetical protein
MIHHLRTRFAQIGRLLGSKVRTASQSRLMGMYLDQTNRPTGAGMRGGASQQRQGGIELERTRAKAWWRREGSGKNANEFIFGAMGFRRAGCMAHMRRRFWQARELPQSDGDLLSVLGTVGDL